MSKTLQTETKVEDFEDEGADEKLVIQESFVKEGESINRQTRVAELDDGGLMIIQEDQTFEQVYLGAQAKIELLSHLGGKDDG